MQLRSKLGVLCGLFLVIGCGDDDVVCGPGTVLQDGECTLDDGGTDATVPDAGMLSCGEGTVEIDGECVAMEARRPIGSACTSNDQCQTGTCAPGMDNLPGGYCTVLGCGMDNPCPVGSTCYALNSNLSLCMAYCDRNTECRTGENYHCQPLYTTEINICAPSCTLTGSCTSGTRCNETSGKCELAECDVDDPGDACSDEETCYADSKGLSSEGGLCLRLCDPENPEEECQVDRKEVCQPMAADPTKGFCAPPVCSSNAECPAGAVCSESVCLAPSTCDDDDACDDDETCVSGKCMPKCPSGDDACSDIHPGLVCAAVLATPACLPLGTFPGSSCRADPNDRCSSVRAGDMSAPMVCEDDVCLAECTSGGDAFCSELSADLECARGVLSTDVCLPKGSFPGSACGSGDSCAQDLNGDPAIDMQCVAGTCAIGCSEDGTWPGYGDALCSLVDASLTCSNSAGSICVLGCDEGACGDGYSCLDPGTVPDHENACLPTGSFPGSPCRSDAANACDSDLGGNADADMVCVEGTCVVSCPGNNDALCAAVDGSLTCSESAGNVCVLACDEGSCPTGYSCLDPGGDGHQNACLPTGSFPSSPCRATSGDECDQDLGGNAAADMVCVEGQCVVSCPSNDDALCAGVDSRLTCAESAGNLCVFGCASGNCLPGYSCLDPGGQNACLPTGSFPSSPCRATVGDECDQDLAGNTAVDMTCVSDVCMVSCTGNNDLLCSAVDSGLTCSESAGDLCVVGCVSGVCPTDFSCLDPGGENACLPTGSFPGSPCRATVGDECDDNLRDVEAADMVCTGGLCVLPCANDDDALCGMVDSTLTCWDPLDVCLLQCGDGDSCPAGYNCDTMEDACVPS